MIDSRKDQAMGLFHQGKGLAKEFAGRVSGNTRLEAEGVVERAAGKVLGQIGQMVRVMGS